MKNIKQILYFLFLLPTISNAQIAEKDTSILLNLPADKVYLSFDKPYYTTGETMYFKAFLTNATSHQLDTFTTVLYVDIMNLAKKSTISQQKIKIVKGVAFGSFNTEGSHGEVFFHAYTRWMGNIAADFHFNKTIQIFEPKDPNALVISDKKPKKKIIVPATKLDVPEVNNDSIKNAANQPQLPEKTAHLVKSLQFFPESGNLITDFANRIAFKATDATGKGMAVKGVIKNEKGEEVASFQDHFLGMGRFNLVVKPNEKYTAHIAQADGTTATFDLPKSQNNTATMLVENLTDATDVKLIFYINYDSLTMPDNFQIIAHQRGKVCFRNGIQVKNKKILRLLRLSIPRTAFTEEGIATITLFDDTGKPIAERLTFIRNKKRELSVNLTTEKAIFDKRARVTVNIETKTTDGKPVAADLSFAVTNDTKIGTPQYNEDLRAYLHLRSDLRGHIEQPSFYFEDTTIKARVALDILLMTQGWRRFKWDEKIDSIAFKYEPDLSVEATVRRKKAPAANLPILLFLKRSDDRTITGLGQTDEKGRFALENLDFKDSAQLYVNIANTAKTHTVDQQLPRKIPTVSEPKNYIADLPSSNLDTYLDASQAVLIGQKLRIEREIMLQEFEVKGKKKDPFEGDKRINSGFVDRSYIIDENENGSVISFLESKFIKVTRTQTGDIVLSSNRSSFGGNYGLVIDGFGQMDGYILNSLFMNDIERIDIINSGDGGYMVSSLGSMSEDGTEMSSGRPNGVVHILTKSGDPNYYKKYGRSLDSDIPMLSLAGYTTQKQFYSPDYSVNLPEYAEKDRRTTLFWSPIIRTDKTGKTTVSFYTTDDAQTAKIQVEGIDATGKIGVAKGTFKVN
jgi:hypothetical protein